MRFPFPRWAAVTPIEVVATIDGEDGVTEETIYSGNCIFDEKSRTRLTADRQLITLGAKAIIEGDISPGKDIKGFVTVYGVQRRIAGTQRPRNIDGAVFSTELDLE